MYQVAREWWENVYIMNVDIHSENIITVGYFFFSVFFQYTKYTQLGDTLDDVVNAKKL